MTQDAIKEIARMQYLIDAYETSLTLLAGMCQSGKNTDILEYDTPCAPWISQIYEFVRKHISKTQRIEPNGKDQGLNDAFKKWYDRNKKRDGESLT